MESTGHRIDPLNTILSQKQYDEISECLAGLAEKLQITAVLLVDSGGRVLSQKMHPTCHLNATLLSTLSASTYAAAKEMARIVGEAENFKMVLHEGERYNIYVANIDGDCCLVVVFERGVALGMVRLFTMKTISRLLPVLAKKDDGGVQLNQVFDRQFRSLLNEELDRTFREFE
ncbi:MAG: roadblock/LC7 domain-containing protein [bacterium]